MVKSPSDKSTEQLTITESSSTIPPCPCPFAVIIETMTVHTYHRPNVTAYHLQYAARERYPRTKSCDNEARQICFVLNDN